MKKLPIKIFGSLLILSIILTIGIALVAPYFISEKTLKLHMGQYLESLLEHRVTFGGKASLRLLPRPTLRTEKVRITDWDDPGKRPLLEIDSIQSSIQVIPLFRNEIVLNELFANGVRAAIEADGDTIHLMKIGDHLDKMSVTSNATTEMGIRSDVDKVVISNATVSLIDKEGGDLFQMKNLHFQLRGKTEKQVSMTFEFADDKLHHGVICGCQGKFKMEGEVQANIQSGQFRLSSSIIESETILHDKKHQLLPVKIRLGLAADSTNGSFTVDNLVADIGEMKIVGDFRGNYLAETREASGALSLKSASMEKAIDFFRPEGISGITGPVETEIDFSIDNQGITLDPFTVQFAKNQMEGRLAYRFSETPALEVALDSDLLDIVSMRQFSIGKVDDISEDIPEDPSSFWRSLLSFFGTNNVDIRLFVDKVQGEKTLAKKVRLAISSKDGSLRSGNLSAQLPNGHITFQAQGDIEEKAFRFDVKSTIADANHEDIGPGCSDPVVTAEGRFSGSSETFSGDIAVNSFSLNRLLTIFNLSVPTVLRRELFDDVSATIEISGDRNRLLGKKAIIRIKDQQFRIRHKGQESKDGRNEFVLSSDMINLDRYLSGSSAAVTVSEPTERSGYVADLLRNLPDLRMNIQAKRFIANGMTFKKGRFVLLTKTNVLEIQPFILHLKSSRLEGSFMAELNNRLVGVRSKAIYEGKLVDLIGLDSGDSPLLSKKLRMNIDFRSSGIDLDAIKNNITAKVTAEVPAQKQRAGTGQALKKVAWFPDLAMLRHTIEIELTPTGASVQKRITIGFHIDGKSRDRDGKKRLGLTADGTLQAWGHKGKISLGETSFALVTIGQEQEDMKTRFSAGGKVSGSTASKEWVFSDLKLAAPGFTASGFFSANISQGKGFSGKGEVDMPPFNLSRSLESAGYGFYRRSDPQTYQNARLKSHVEVNSGGIHFSDLTLAIDETTLRGSVRLAGFNKPFIKVDLRGDVLDLDRYLPDGEEEPEAEETQTSQEDFFLQGNLKFSRFTVVDIEIEKLATGISLSPRKLICEPFATDLAGGKARGAYRMDFGPRHDTAFLEVDAKSFRAEEVLRYLTGKEEKLTGIADVDLKMTWTIGPYEQFAKTVDGTMKVVLTDGKLKKENKSSIATAVDIAEKIDITNIRHPENEWPYTKGTASCSTQNGIVQSSDTVVALKDGTNVRGRGKINLSTNGVQYRFDVDLPNSMYPTIPFDVTGYYPDVDVKVNTVAFAKSSAGDVAAIPGSLVRETVEGGKKIFSGARDAVDYVGDGLKEIFTW